MEEKSFNNLYLDPKVEMTAYRPPKSTGFGHRTRKKDIHKAWASIENFLEKHTYHKCFYDSGIELSFCRFDNNIDKALLQKYTKKAQLLFGSGIDAQNWLIPDNKLPIVIEFILDCKQNINQKMSFINVSLSRSFLWKKFANSDLIESPQFEDEILFRTITSSISIYIEEDYIFIQPEFIFPCTWDSVAFAEIYNSIYPDCPILLREKNFYKMILKKDKKRHYQRKLPLDWKQQQLYLLSS